MPNGEQTNGTYMMYIYQAIRQFQKRLASMIARRKDSHAKHEHNVQRDRPLLQ